MCSSTLFVNCEQVAKDTVEKILCRTQFRSGHMLAICAGLSSKGKVGVQRGRKTAGCPSFLPPRRAPRRSRRPQTANPPLRFSGKLSARQGRTRLRQFECPAWSVQRKVPPGQGEHANAVRAPRSAGAEKAAAPFERTACAARVSRLTLRSYLTILRRQSMLSQQQNRRKYEPVHPCTLRSVPRH